jgi:hypothetical protein
VSNRGQRRPVERDLVMTNESLLPRFVSAAAHLSSAVGPLRLRRFPLPTSPSAGAVFLASPFLMSLIEAGLIFPAYGNPNSVSA